MSSENHNHITRDIKPPGQCYSCDRYHALSSKERILTLEDLILFVEELYESHGAQEALRHLQAFIQNENLREKHKQ